MKLTGITSYQLGLLAIKPLHWLDITIIIGEYLKNAGGLFNRIETNSAQVAEMEEMYSMYFNLGSLLFSSS